MYRGACVVVWCVGSGDCDELISHLEESYRMSVSDCVWSRDLSRPRLEFGSCGHGIKKKYCMMGV